MSCRKSSLKLCTICTTGFNLLALLVLTILFASKVWLYLIEGQWNRLIQGLGSDLFSRVLMGIHFIGGLTMMTVYPIQKALMLLGSDKPLIRLTHKLNGISGIAAGLITGIFGSAYILYHGTIGGLWMDIGFGIYGVLVFAVSFTLALISAEMHSNSDYEALRFYKQLHQYFTSLFGALTYASLFYRIQYIFANKIVGYEMPNQCPVQPVCYERPLDRVFIFTFWIIPIVLQSAYAGLLYYKCKRTISALTICLSLVLVFSIALLFI